ncbi:MAG TPA: SDR family oxidoreductase [Terriglobales bacterium]|nr:SDR family oxidoreductase [Terriglobales bacterium]
MDPSKPHSAQGGPSVPVYWRVEGSLLDLTTVQPVAFFTWNAQTFGARMVRRGLVFLMAALRPFLYAAHRVFATRVVHSVLRGVSRDRLDLLGDEYFEYKLKPHLKSDGVARLKKLQSRGAEIVLVSQGLDHVMRPLAQFLGVKWLLVNRLDFRDRVATGRLLSPVIRPRGLFARITGAGPDGQREPDRLARELDLPDAHALSRAIVPAERSVPNSERPVVYFDNHRHAQPLSVRKTMAGKHVMLVGFTGFIGKVWLVNILLDVPEIGRIYLLIRRQKSNPASKRFERVVEESPVFDPLFDRHSFGLSAFLKDKVEVIEGDVTQPGLGIEPETARRLQQSLDLIINSSGLTDFNPDLRDALATNVDAAVHVLDFVRQSDHCGLVHLSTCYVAGARDGRVSEKLRPNYTPGGVAGYDAEQERRNLHQLVQGATEKAESAQVTAELTQEAVGKEHAAKDLHGAALENQIRKGRIRWLRNYLTEAGARRAAELGWPNTYTLTKSLAESLIGNRAAGLPVAIVRPAIVETSVAKPFTGWNEGINTSASLSYLLGTNFRQLPSNERKRLDIIPVDSVCQGMTLIAAAVIERRHDTVYQLATSVTNPCDMGRSIELTSLAHRKHYRAQEGLESWLRLRMDAIPVSKTRYNRLSAPAQMAIVKSIQRIMAPLPLKKTPLARAERNLEKVGKLVHLFAPFILHNEHDFVADNVEKLSMALVPEERHAFGYDTRSLDWWAYWIDIHIPALRRWTYPLIEGRPLAVRPPRPLLPAQEQEPTQGETVKTGTNGATWRYS